MSALSLVRLLQLTSQVLPIGGYSHSQGLETAIEQKIVRDERSLLRWIHDALEFSMSSFEIPYLVSMAAMWAEPRPAAVEPLNEEFLATRESAEMRAATVQMGFSLRALLCQLTGVPQRTLDALSHIREPSLPCVWSAAAAAWQIEPQDAAAGYLWSWAENQVLAAMKLVPLGQSAGQRTLMSIGSRIAQFAAGSGPGEADVSNFCPGLAILSSQHEIQYSRIFRS